MQKNSIIKISQNDMNQVFGGIEPGQINSLFLVGAGAVSGVVITGAAMWMMHSFMSHSRAKVEERLIKAQNITKAFCGDAKKIVKQCLVLEQSEDESNLKSEL